MHDLVPAKHAQILSVGLLKYFTCNRVLVAAEHPIGKADRIEGSGDATSSGKHADPASTQIACGERSGAETDTGSTVAALATCDTVCFDLEQVGPLDIGMIDKLDRQRAGHGVGPPSKGCRHVHEPKMDSVAHEHLDRSAVDQTKKKRVVQGAKPCLDSGRQINAKKKTPKGKLGVRSTDLGRTSEFWGWEGPSYARMPG